MNRRTFLTTSTAGLVSVAGCLGYDIISSDELARLHEENRALSRQLSNNVSRVSTLESSLNSSRDTIEGLERNLTAKRTTIERLEGENEDFELRITNQTETISSLQSDLQAKRDRIEELETDLQAKRERIADLEGEVQSLSSALTETEADVAALESEVATLQSQIETYESRIEELTTEHDFTAYEVDTAVEHAMALREAVVFLDAGGQYGTAFQVDDGVFATANHIYSAASDSDTTPYVQDFDENTYDVETISSATEPDLRAVESTPRGTAPGTVTVSDTTSLSEGDPVVTVGHPYSVGLWVISIGRFTGTTNGNYVVDMPVRSGSSGSPVLTIDGQFAGMAIQNVAQGELEIKPEDPYFDFQEHPPNGILTPGQTVKSHLEEWGIV